MALFSFGKDNSNGNGNGHGADQAAGGGVAVAPQPPAMPAAPTPTVTPERQAYLTQMRVKIHQKLVERLNVQNLRSMPINVVRQEVRTLIRELYQSEKGLLSSAEQAKLMDDVMDETFGLGPLEGLLKDPTITDILVNRFDRCTSSAAVSWKSPMCSFATTRTCGRSSTASWCRSAGAWTRSARWSTRACRTAAA